MSQTITADSEITTTVTTDTPGTTSVMRPQQRRVLLPPLTLPPTGDGYLGERQVCAVLQVSRSTLWRWRREGRLVPVRFGRMTRWRIRDVRTLL